MKREEILSEIDRRIDELYDARTAAKAFESKAAYTDQIIVLASFSRWINSNIPANAITLTLPTYAPGDPKAGEVVQYDDTVYAINGFSFLANDWRFDGPGEHEVSLWECDGSPGMEDSRIPGPYYSTPEARDAAMEAPNDQPNQ